MQAKPHELKDVKINGISVKAITTKCGHVAVPLGEICKAFGVAADVFIKLLNNAGRIIPCEETNSIFEIYISLSMNLIELVQEDDVKLGSIVIEEAPRIDAIRFEAMSEVERFLSEARKLDLID